MAEDIATRLLAAIELREQHAKKDIWAAGQATPGNWNFPCPTISILARAYGVEETLDAGFEHSITMCNLLPDGGEQEFRDVPPGGKGWVQEGSRRFDDRVEWYWRRPKPREAR